jgi:hypothetical protein
MNKIYGPFYLGIDETWHWHKECSQFPDIKKAKSMVSSSFPDEIELCCNCLQLDKKNISGSSARKDIHST